MSNLVTQKITKLVSDISSKQSDRQSPPDRGGPPSGADAQQRASAATGVPNWQLTGTLSALQELVEVAEAVPAVVARQAGLSTSELHSLRHLMRGPMGPVDLAKVLGVTSAASSGVVDRLCSHGHAVRRAHPDDGRRTEVVITDSGRAEVTARMRPMFVALAELDASLTDDERVVVERYLRGATAAMHDLVT
ncbi:DNA-binding MarR family transcriptional regulator [Humibacillus xanthopallidus]|uniref:DNA-binding MarR family transcriptional regulator n=1 Tax=Humibacillus xanthopallidus TaxID=412689 RepID=A0A543PMN1_9MICO|nr:DNA-binding MarR family transcriptional regulator [Humibacillus xanthopallidus]